MSYQDFLLNLVKVDKQVLWFFHNQGTGSFCVGVDCFPALFAWQDGLPGFSGMNLEPSPNGLLADLPGGHHGRQIGPGGGPTVHFPDGNATIARLLIRWLIPDAVPGKSMEDVGAAHVDYATLDRSGQTARVRLNSTVVQVGHDGEPGRAKEAVTSYIRGGKTYHVRSRAVVMACWNMFIPYSQCIDWPGAQKEALAFGVEGAARLYKRRGEKLEGVPEAGRVRRQCADDVPHWRAAVGSREPRRTAPPADARRADRAAPDAISDVTRQAAKRAAPNRPGGSLEHELRDVREVDPRSARAQPGRGRIRSGRRHHRDRRQSVASRLRLHLQSALRSDGVGLHVHRRSPVRQSPKAFRLDYDCEPDAAASLHTDAAMLEAHRAVQEVLQRRAMPSLG